MSEPTYLVLGVDLRDHIITQQVKTTLLAVSLLTVFTAQTSLFHENCVSRFKLTPQPIPPCIDRTYIKQQCSVCVRLFYFELSTAWVHVASLAIYRIEPSRPNGPDTGWAPGSWSVVHVVLVTSSSYSIEHRPTIQSREGANMRD